MTSDSGFKAKVDKMLTCEELPGPGLSHKDPHYELDIPNKSC